MYSVNSLTYFLYTSIASDSTLVNSNTKVFHEKFINQDINTTPSVYVNWAGEQTNQENSLIGKPTLMRPWNIQIDYTFYLQCANYNRNPTETVNKLNSLWDSVYSAVITGITNSAQTLNCDVNPVSWTREPDLRSIEDLKNNRQTLFSDLVVFTFQVFG